MQNWVYTMYLYNNQAAIALATLTFISKVAGICAVVDQICFFDALSFTAT